MIVQCDKCKMYFDDEFRNTLCQHNTFLANDGQNNFKYYPESWLAPHIPRRGFSDPMFEQGHISEHDKYNEFLKENKVNKNEPQS